MSDIIAEVDVLVIGAPLPEAEKWAKVKDKFTQL